MLRANPRGSGGRGAQFRRANKNDWGGGDYQDLMAVLELVPPVAQAAKHILQQRIGRLKRRHCHETDAGDIWQLYGGLQCGIQFVYRETVLGPVKVEICQLEGHLIPHSELLQS